MNDIILKISIYAIPVLFAIALHEAAHAWAANRLGDGTARMLGRMTANPIKHIDPIGTVAVPLLLLATGMPPFGWAKPVPVVERNLHKPKRDGALVAVAGPTANLLMALGWALLMKLGLLLYAYYPWVAAPLTYMGRAGITINIVLFVLNMLPLPPLDGGRVLSGVLPRPYADKLDRVEPYGFFILIGLMMAGVLWTVIGPPFQLIIRVISSVFGLPL